MELSALSQNIVMVPLKHGDETLELQVNIDAFTPQFFREVRRHAEKRFQILETEITKTLRETPKPEKKTKKRTPATDQSEFKRQVTDQLEGIEIKARALEVQREVNIDFLFPGILKGWDVVENGLPVELTRDVLLALPPKLIQDIYDVCVKATQTVKKREDQDEDEATSDSTAAGSRGLRAVGQTT
jgi:hypothetical protein